MSRNVGLIGVGAHATENLLPALRAIPDVRVRAVVSREPARSQAFADRWGIPVALGTVEQLVESGLDLVVAAATPQVHLATLDIALLSGTNAYLEKPPAPSGYDLAQVIARHPESAGVATVGYNFRFADVSDRALSMLPAIGSARHAQITLRTRKPLNAIWGFADAQRSFLYAVGIHAIDFAFAIFPSAAVSSIAGCQVSADRFSCSLTLTSPDGAVCDVLISNAANRFEFEVDITGETGRVTAHDLTTVQLQRYDPVTDGLGDKAVERRTLSGLQSGYLRTGYQRLLEQALDARSVTESPAPIRDSVRILELLDAVCDHLGFS